MSEDNLYAAPEADIAPNESGQLAGRGIRLGGAIIDGLLAMAIIFPVMFMSGYWDRAMMGEESIMDAALIAGVGVIAFLVLQGYLLANYGQTIGKRILGTRIVSVEDDNILPFGKVISLRYLPIWLVSVIPILGPIVSLVDPIFIFREDRRCIHDLIAGTKVVVASKS